MRTPISVIVCGGKVLVSTEISRNGEKIIVNIALAPDEAREIAKFILRAAGEVDGHAAKEEGEAQQ